MKLKESLRLYLVRAYHEYITNQGGTPYIVVIADFPGCQVPMEYVQNGTITLNISYGAANGLEITNESISFSARFNKVARTVHIPEGAVAAIYAREMPDISMAFPVEIAEEGENVPAPVTKVNTEVAESAPRERPKLTVVKKD